MTIEEWLFSEAYAREKQEVITDGTKEPSYGCVCCVIVWI